MSRTFDIVSPIDGHVVATRTEAGWSEVSATLERAVAAAHAWRRVPLAERLDVLSRCVDAFVASKDALAREITLQMGRPIAQSPGEIVGFEDRARTMLSLASEALRDVVPEPREGFVRFVQRDPLGVVLVLAPWNYPHLTAVNSVVPALAAGNAVVLKHSEQTALCAESLAAAFREGGLPEDVLQVVHASHATVALALGDARVGFCAFTGSVEGGHAVTRALAGRFAGSGLELGGKDPAYVRADADLGPTIAGVADGAFYNAGQSCCAVERVYAHADVFDDVVAGLVREARALRLGDPRDPTVTLGPMVRIANAERVHEQVSAAVAHGARPLVEPGAFPAAERGTAYVAPQVLVDVDHSMDVMKEETFGPVVGVLRVSSDEEAVELMNDSRYGLTASIWSRDLDAALAIGSALETGTVFLNRCDYLDPALAWTGVKDSGRGCTLSRVGFEQLTRPKSFHMRLAP